MTQFPVGKIPHSYLLSLLKRNRITDPRVIVGPGIGEDAALLDLGGNHYLIAKTDPITFATEEIGWYAVQVNANDIASMGGKPAFFMATLLLPEHRTDDKLIEGIFDQITQACDYLDISLIGGHTEVTYGLDRPIVIGVMLGEGDRKQIRTTGGAKIGDSLLLTKGYPIEATSIIAREKGKELSPYFPEDFISKCANYLHTPGISVVRDAMIAQQVGGVHAMHDPTEGGIATGLWEMAEASGKTFVVNLDHALLMDSARLCEVFDINPIGAIASGSLLISIDPEKEADVISHLKQSGINCYVIGQVINGDDARVLDTITNDLIIRPEQDEITRLFT